MEMDIGMAFEPAVILGLVGIEIVQNGVNFCLVPVAIEGVPKRQRFQAQDAACSAQI